MNPQKLLTGLLGVQVLLTAITWWPAPQMAASRPLIEWKPEQITSVTIHSATTDNLGDGLVLNRQDDGWVIESEYSYPAQPAKVDELLEKLTAIKIRTPVTLQAVRHEQLNVADDNATRRVTVQAGDESVEFLLGIAGNSRSHLRLAGQNEVYTISGLGAWAIRDASTQYLERKVLDVKPGSLESYSLTNSHGTVELVRDEARQWTSPSLAEGQQLDVSKLDKLFQNTLQLSMSSPADPALDPFTRDDAAVLSWSQTVDGKLVSNAVALYSDEAVGIVRIKDQPRPVNIGSVTTQNVFADTTLDRLLVGAPDEGPVIK